MSTGKFNVDNGPAILPIPGDLSCCQVDKASYCRQTFSRIHIVGKKWCFVFPQANILLGNKMQLAMGFVRTNSREWRSLDKHTSHNPQLHQIQK